MHVPGALGYACPPNTVTEGGSAKGVKYFLVNFTMSEVIETVYFWAVYIPGFAEVGAVLIVILATVSLGGGRSLTW